MNVNDYLTHIDNVEDISYLRAGMYDVNMRLFGSSRTYRQIVQGCCHYLRKLALTEMAGYKLPHGMSGANIGIPFNIIGVVKNRGRYDADCRIMINPKIINYSQETVETLSNCGSIRLPDSIPITRSTKIGVEFFDIDGKCFIETFGRGEGAFTIQHEVDHNNGILITDRNKQLKENIL